jgi:hypothetical protein
MATYSSSHSECSICLENCLENTHLEVLTCCHTFHSACIGKWFEQGSINCPLCRSPTKREDSPLLIGNILKKYYDKFDRVIRKLEKFEKFSRYQALSKYWLNKVDILEEQSHHLINCIETINSQ